MFVKFQKKFNILLKNRNVIIKIKRVAKMNIAYLYYTEENADFRGGVLLTDEKTKPIEFRITTEVSLDELQKIIYGDSLKEVLFKEKFGIDLLNALKEKYDIVLTKDKDLLTIRKSIDAPVIFVRKFDPFMAKDKYSHKIINIYNKFDPLMITISKEDEKKLISISKALNEIYKNFNIMEPFQRIENAIQYIAMNEKNAKLTTK